MKTFEKTLVWLLVLGQSLYGVSLQAAGPAEAGIDRAKGESTGQTAPRAGADASTGESEPDGPEGHPSAVPARVLGRADCSRDLSRADIRRTVSSPCGRPPSARRTVALARVLRRLPRDRRIAERGRRLEAMLEAHAVLVVPSVAAPEPRLGVPEDRPAVSRAMRASRRRGTLANRPAIQAARAVADKALGGTVQMLARIGERDRTAEDARATWAIGR